MFSENFSDFINPSTPGYRVVLIDYEQAEVIFDDNYVEDGFTESASPVLWVESSKVPCIEHGDMVADQNKEEFYEVVGVQPDGSGITFVKLKIQ